MVKPFALCSYQVKIGISIWPCLFKCIIFIEEKSDKVKSTILASLNQTTFGFENVHDVVQVSPLPKSIHLRFSSSQREAWCPCSSHSSHCPPQPWATTDLLSMSIDLPMGDIS